MLHHWWWNNFTPMLFWFWSLLYSCNIIVAFVSLFIIKKRTYFVFLAVSHCLLQQICPRKVWRIVEATFFQFLWNGYWGFTQHLHSLQASFLWLNYLFSLPKQRVNENVCHATQDTSKVRSVMVTVGSVGTGCHFCISSITSKQEVQRWQKKLDWH